MDKIKLKSNRFGTEYPVEIYKKDDVLIITHTSLENAYWSLADNIRPSYRIETINLRNLPGIPPMFAVNCIMEDNNGVKIEQIGEMLCTKWQNENLITQNFPLTTCKNMAFDRAFIRYMQFEFSMFDVSAMYSTSEIEISAGNDIVPVTSKEMVRTEPDIPDSANETDHSSVSSAGSGNRQMPGKTTRSAEKNTVPTGILAQNAPEPSYAAPMPEKVPENPSSGMKVYQVPDNGWQGQPDPGFFAGDVFGGLPEEYVPMDVYHQAFQNFQKRQCTVTNVSINQAKGMLRIQTSDGSFYFTPADGRWQTDGPNPDDYDLDDLYQKASIFIGRDLNQFVAQKRP